MKFDIYKAEMRVKLKEYQSKIFNLLILNKFE